MDLETILTAMCTGVGFGVIVFLLFVWVISKRLQIRFESDLNRVIQDIDTESLIALTVESFNDQYLCYNAVTNEFVCQGRDLKEIVDRFKARYPEKAAAIYNGDEQAVQTLRVQMKDLHQTLDL